MTRYIMVIRHAERIDNVNSNWRKDFKDQFTADNSPLSPRGHKQCSELKNWFKHVPVDHLFASPFDRTLDTATRMIGDRNIPIKPEAGFLEALYLCDSPPGVRPLATLKEKYPLLDDTYEPVYNPWTTGLGTEPIGDHGCTQRVAKTLKTLLNTYDGHIVIVSHGAPIGALLDTTTKNWTYVGQATVTTLILRENYQFDVVSIANDQHLSDKRNLRPW